MMRHAEIAGAGSAASWPPLRCCNAAGRCGSTSARRCCGRRASASQFTRTAGAYLPRSASWTPSWPKPCACTGVSCATTPAKCRRPCGKVAVHRVSRQNIVAALADKAASLGGEIVTGSPVASAEPEGVLVLEGGGRFKAGLIIGADGYNSRVRESVDLLAQRAVLRDGAMRLIIPRTAEERAADPEGCATGSENWSGTRRVVYGACAVDEVYLALSCLYGDEDAMAVPVRTEAWRRSLPYLGGAFDRIEQLTEWDRVKWDRFQTIKLKKWSRGRVAILGDAAHAMPPNLGQGGNCAIMNAFSLAVALEDNGDTHASLARWEQNERPITEDAQRWSRVYGAVTLWPERLETRFLA